jgi:hypothetical protein
VVIVSTNGLTWQPAAQNLGAVTHGIAYGEGRFVNVGDFGQIFTSPDGHRWTFRESGTLATLRDVVFGDRTFVAVGGGGAIFSSFGGTNWIEHPRHTSSQAAWALDRVAFGQGYFVAIGGYGTVLRSAPVLQLSAPRLRPGAEFQTTVIGRTNRIYRIEVSTNLVTWEAGGSVETDGDGRALHFEPSNTESLRFLRAVSPSIPNDE